MYPKNASSPKPIRAKVVSATDGSAITTGVVAYHIQGSTRSAVSGTAAAHIANGVWIYTPTQGETNYDAFDIEFYHTSAVGSGPVVHVVTCDAKTEVADPLLDRDMSVGTDSGGPTVRTVRQALRFLRNKWAISGTTLTVRKEDDATASWTTELTTSAGANPVVGSDPASS
jgi:hypothetical protein